MRTVNPQRGGRTTSPVEICPAARVQRPDSTPAVTPNTVSVEQAQALEGSQARALCLHFILDFHGQPLLFAAGGAEGAHQSDVAHDVRQIAAHMRRVPRSFDAVLAPGTQATRWPHRGR